MGFQTFDEHTLLLVTVAFDDASFPVAQQFQAPSNVPARWDTLLASNSDTIAHTLIVGMTDGTTEIVVGSVTVVAGAGVTVGTAVDLLAAALPATTQWLFSNLDRRPYVRLGEAINAGKLLCVTAFGGAF